jgi:hypothetical protein
LEYHQVDVRDTDKLESVIKNIAAERKQLNGLIAGMSPYSMHSVSCGDSIEVIFEGFEADR